MAHEPIYLVLAVVAITLSIFGWVPTDSCPTLPGSYKRWPIEIQREYSCPPRCSDANN